MNGHHEDPPRHPYQVQHKNLIDGREGIWIEFRRLILSGVVFAAVMVLYWVEIRWLNLHDLSGGSTWTLPENGTWIIAPLGVALAFTYSADKKVSDLLNEDLQSSTDEDRSRAVSALVSLDALRGPTWIVVALSLGVTLLNLGQRTVTGEPVLASYLAVGLAVLLAWLAAGVLARSKNLGDEVGTLVKRHRQQLRRVARLQWPEGSRGSATVRFVATLTIVGGLSAVATSADVSAIVGAVTATLLAMAVVTYTFWHVATAQPGLAALIAVLGAFLTSAAALNAAAGTATWTARVIILLTPALSATIAFLLTTSWAQRGVWRHFDLGPLTLVRVLLDKTAVPRQRQPRSKRWLTLWYRRLSGQTSHG